MYRYLPMEFMLFWGVLGAVSALWPQAASAQATDTSPSGMVAYFSTQSECPDGWEPATYLQGRLGLGTTDTAGWTLLKQVGTALENETAPSHDHPFGVTLSLPQETVDTGYCGGSTTGGAKNGDYTVNGPALSGNTGLPLFQILACEKKDSGQSPPPTDDYGTSALAFFNLSSCPTNWQPAIGYPQGYQMTWTGSQNYQIVITFDGTDSDNDGVLRGRGSDPSKIAGGKTNELNFWTMAVLQNGQEKVLLTWNTQKTRSDFNFNYAIASKEVYASVQFSEENGLNVGMPGTGNNDYNFFSNQAAGNIWLVHAGDNSTAVKGPLGNTQFTAGTPSSAVDGYFVMPFEAPPDGSVGTLVGNPYSNGEERTHTHTLTSSIDLDTRQYELAPWFGSCSSLTSDGKHSFSGTTEAVFNNVPYTQLLLCEREPNFSSANPPTGVPTNVVTFFGSQNCPYGWKPSPTGSGRFLVGLPAGGNEDQAFGGGNPLQTPGDRPQHTHGLKGSVSISEQKVALASGTDSPVFGHDGTYDYSGSTNSSDFGLPYLTVANCQPCVVNDSNPVCHEQAQSKE
ncbi:MAG: hypothetical protein MRJ67_05835 [Nitrospirales bacterium]|nr:hypothetical protein [Nitrospirales bacterium]